MHSAGWAVIVSTCQCAKMGVKGGRYLAALRNQQRLPGTSAGNGRQGAVGAQAAGAGFTPGRPGPPWLQAQAQAPLPSKNESKNEIQCCKT